MPLPLVRRRNFCDANKTYFECSTICACDILVSLVGLAGWSQKLHEPIRVKTQRILNHPIKDITIRGVTNREMLQFSDLSMTPSGDKPEIINWIISCNVLYDRKIKIIYTSMSMISLFKCRINEKRVTSLCCPVGFNRQIVNRLLVQCIASKAPPSVPKKPSFTGLNDYKSEALASGAMKSLERTVLTPQKHGRSPAGPPSQWMMQWPWGCTSFCHTLTSLCKDPVCGLQLCCACNPHRQTL